MQDLLTKTGRNMVRVLVKVLAAVCAAVLSLMEAAGREGRKGGK